MNAVEIEEAVSALADRPFDPAEFPFEFLAAYGNKDTTVRRLRTRSGNTSDVEGGVLQRNHIHLAIAAPGQVGEMLEMLRASPKTSSNKARFILATDGVTLEAEDLTSGETVAPDYERFSDAFAFFLPLAGISIVKAIKNNPIDIKATGRLNKLYVELLRDNPDWSTPERRHDLNQFMARLIFCFFAEDTGIFLDNLFTGTLKQMSDGQSGNTHEVLAELFRAMDTPTRHEGQLDNRYRKAAGVKLWADAFPYVNGGMFTGGTDCPRFSRLARSYLLRAGELDWQQINPDIFGSMIQAVADDEERGELGMHYTSVPNILKVLNPLLLDDLRAELERAGDNPRMLRSLRKRLSRIRVFDPACGSGNFLVIAYKEMRAIEAQIVKRTGDEPKSVVPLSNFYGIEIKGFAAEIARLAMLIAEFQSDVLFIDQQAARLNVLPLHRTGKITTGNALRLDWLEVCPPTNLVAPTAAPFVADPDRIESKFPADEVETYICGNPPYVGDKFQTVDQKRDLRLVSNDRSAAKSIDYVVGWIWKASRYVALVPGTFAFVATSSIIQGVQVPIIWPPIFDLGQEIVFGHLPFFWSNAAQKNASVVCVIVGVSGATRPQRAKYLYWDENRQEVTNINAYLVNGPDVVIGKHLESISKLPTMFAGNISRDEGNLMLTEAEKAQLLREFPQIAPIVRRIVGSYELINGIVRHCLWIEDQNVPLAESVPAIRKRLERVRRYRETGSDRGKLGIDTPHRFERTILGSKSQIVVPRVSSEQRPYLPVGLTTSEVVVSDAAQAIYDAPAFVLSILCSKLHLSWVSLTAGRMKSDFRYSTGVCYNSFPVPPLTDQNKADLTRCAEDILLAREAHFPATIADLYEPKAMPESLRAAHERNDETLERIYIGRRFRNDTERLEKLFELYTKMTANENNAKVKAGRKRGNGDD